MALHDEAIEIIRDIGARKGTFAEIREAVWAACGIEPTRGQVAGVLHRARARGHVSRGATSSDQRPRPSAVPPDPTNFQTATAAARPNPVPTLAAGAPSSPRPPTFACDEPPVPSSRAEHGACRLDQLSRRHCRWPLWGGERPHPDTALYCGDRTVDPTTPYCFHHRGIGASAYTKEKNKW